MTVVQDVSLSDRYEARVGRVHLTGIQALARVPIDQARRDRLSGLHIGTFVSGYEGSPLAGYDLELLRQRDLLDEHDIIFEPGLNEEAAAMAVQGSQLIDALPTTVDGAVGFWYGKAPGLDRASDALRHANLMGTHPRGGAVALVGDDPAAKSSSVPCASDHALADLGMPTFYPSDAGEVLTMGRHAVAMSRATGLWSAMKIVTSVADGSTTVDLLPDDEEPLMPWGGGKHEPSAKLLPPHLGPIERDFQTTRMRLAHDYIRINRLNAITVRHREDRIGIVAAGPTYLEVREALAILGLDDDDLATLGIRLLKVGVIWPLEPVVVEEFAEGLERIVVVEAKRSFLEAAIRDILYGRSEAPAVVGKREVDGRDLLPAHGDLSSSIIASALARALDLPAPQTPATRRLLPLVQRAPYYCSGCPHSTSTRPHTDSPVGGGIGCHAMVLLMDPEQVGDVLGLTQMGGEGTQWIGMAPFVENPHLVQNVGDGTFHHSGSLAIRAAVASGVNITYRVLVNDVVAMTGGQDAVGQMDVAHMVRHLQSEGVARIIVTTEDVKALRRQGVPRGVAVWPRERIAEAERELAATKGTTVLIHQQECATELRRKRKRGLVEAPDVAVVINERLCEGCGDCGAKSNCLSVQPIETEFGSKTTIHQASCNTDLTCLAGDCPAFMTVTGGTKRTAAKVTALEPGELPEPAATAGRTRKIRLMGVGGTGVVTTSQVLATAALLSGRHVRTLDQTGLAQKGGAVVSDVKFSDEPIDAGSMVSAGECDVYLGLDSLVAGADANVAVLSPHGTAIVSTSRVPTGAMVSDRSIAFPDDEEVLAPLRERVGERVVAFDARAIVEALFGAEQFVNLFMVGMAHQRGVLGLSAEAIEQAVTLNGVAVESNLQAFRRGRQYMADPASLHAVVASLGSDGSDRPAPAPSTIVVAPPGSELERLVALRRVELTAFQNSRVAERYERLVERVRQAEEPLGTTSLAEAVAQYAFKLMAYKDEYEVARLALDEHVRASIGADFGEHSKIAWRLHPPVFRAMGMKDKIAIGPVLGRLMFGALRRMRHLRGTPLDVFGYARVRKVERRLVAEYIEMIDELLPRLDASTAPTIHELAVLPDLVRGYEDIKLRNVQAYEERRVELRRTLGTCTSSPSSC